MFLCGCLEWVLLSRSWGWGRVERGRAPRGAPALGSRESGNDDGGGGTGRGLLVSEGESRSCGTGGSRTAPTTGCWGCAEVRVAEGEVPACAGTTMGGAGGRRRERETAPPGAPALGSRFRGNDDGGRPFDRLRANGVARGAGGGDMRWLRLWYICSILDVIQLRTGVRRSGVWITGLELCSWNARSLCWPLGLTASIFCGSCGGCGSSRGAGRGSPAERGGVGRCGRRSSRWS